MSRFLVVLLGTFILLNTGGAWAQATKETDKPAANQDEKTKTIDIVTKGKLKFKVPGNWKKKQPKFPQIIEFEFEIPKVEGDERAGRMTISTSGGSIQGNITRWKGQFKNLDENDKKAYQKETKTVGGLKVHLITLNGTFLDGSPMGPKTPRDDYRMQGMIIERDGKSSYFLKAYGGQKTMDANKAGIKRMFDSMQAADN